MAREVALEIIGYCFRGRDVVCCRSRRLFEAGGCVIIISGTALLLPEATHAGICCISSLSLVASTRSM